MSAQWFREYMFNPFTTPKPILRSTMSAPRHHCSFDSSINCKQCRSTYHHITSSRLASNIPHLPATGTFLTLSYPFYFRQPIFYPASFSPCRQLSGDEPYTG
jgi:hypothetical protein